MLAESTAGNSLAHNQALIGQTCWFSPEEIAGAFFCRSFCGNVRRWINSFSFSTAGRRKAWALPKVRITAVPPMNSRSGSRLSYRVRACGVRVRGAGQTALLLSTASQVHSVHFRPDYVCPLPLSFSMLKTKAPSQPGRLRHFFNACNPIRRRTNPIKNFRSFRVFRG